MERVRIFCIRGQSCPPELCSWLSQNTTWQVIQYPSAEMFLKSYAAGDNGCVVASVNLPGMSGWILQEKLAEVRDILPVILIDDDDSGSLPLAVQAARNGVCDLLRTPVSEDQLVKRVDLALQRAATGIVQRRAATDLLEQAGLSLISVAKLARENTPTVAADTVVSRLCHSANLRETQIPAARRDWLRNVVLHQPIEELKLKPTNDTNALPPPWLLEAAHYVRKCAQDATLSNTTELLLKTLGVAREALSRREMALVEDVAMLALRDQSALSTEARRHRDA